ncbi:primosomal protein N',Primosomal protein N',primosome assembly protein PriA,ATP-dependent protease HslVU (ClpYQ), peptidase subunit,primosomal protein N',Type III restriction enzyme, res subunit [[Clostridium] sordellii]|uniref:primosomal protein N' n=1 Tax=Paraclostridium sordellii TaxID=1505 RepID=UPI000541D429|nr:primosomal protein N' [Paeniclostridium sordellii]CEK35642.1 primosomal protein N',Primosomal protein N',primosome assembly protein PriA,ATP-dependent protease HslVU (ClpYQ), peptidase subunit,primosomal protein N',Type III restriction enzyme, res subunit [[Clostridium] sordellii] [Paeniclostridium sordellii]
MKQYAKVIVRNNSTHTDNLFTYEIPEFLSENICIGHRVLVPFGMYNKPVEAFVFEIDDYVDENIRTKKITDLLDEEPIFNKDDINLIIWMKNKYLCTYIDCINLLYPKGYKLNNYKVIKLIDENYTSENKNEQKLIDTLKENKNEVRIDKIKKIPNLNNIIYKLKKLNVVNVIWRYNDHKNEKKVYMISLSKQAEEIDEYLKENKIRLGSKQKEILEYIKNVKEIDLGKLLENTNATRQSINGLKEKNIINIKETDFYRNPEQIYSVEHKDIKLNEEQEKVVNLINQEMFNEDKKPYMIHGVTGSGKTEVYMEIIENALNQGLDSLMLVPEISLTPQTISRFRNKFGNIVGVFHSQLSEGEKHDVYKQVKEGKIRILIGARSALFMPFTSLGVIIIDEFHESAYKSEKNPKFNTIEVANFISRKREVSLVLGSATPSIDEYYKAINGQYKLLEINKRANNKPMPKIEVVDMKDELMIGNKSIFSSKLKLDMEEAVKNKNQIILFLNRRGYSNFVSCRKCGYVFTCENCDISLTYHKKSNTGKCHYCGYEKEIPKECPECKSKYIKPFGIGTQKIEEEIKSLFPNMRVLRLDRDTTSKKGSFDRILNSFKNKEADVLIGTQMLSKGLDFDNVTLVGILSADMILKFPDFRSAENTFQLITQVSGRAGRSEQEGKVILQTYDTEHYAIKHAINYDFKGFYQDEIKIRKLFDYAPFNNMLSVVLSGKNNKLVEINAKKMYDTLAYLLNERGIEDLSFILGPNQCSISKINQNYRWQILFKDEDIEINLLKGIIKYICITKREIVFDKDINISIDINPYSVL